MKNKKDWRSANCVAYIFTRYINGFRHPSKLRFVRWMGRILFPNGVPLISESGSLFNADHSQFIGWQILASGSYEPKTIKLGREILQGGGVYVDVGANVGLHLSSWGSLPGVNSIAIEPLPSNYAKLRSVALANRIGLNMLYNIAVSDIPQLVILEEVDPQNNGKTRVSVTPDSTENFQKTTVAALPLEKILSHASVEEVVLLKIDVEGYELPVLRSLDWNGPFRPRNVIIEYGDYSARVDGMGRGTIFDFFDKLGYAGYEVDGRPLLIDATPVEDNAWFVDLRYIKVE
jgi:FkbM family methyltransferase